jgi:hypothetical protein
MHQGLHEGSIALRRLDRAHVLRLPAELVEDLRHAFSLRPRARARLFRALAYASIRLRVASLERADDAGRGEIDREHEGEAEPQQPSVRMKERRQQRQARVGSDLG